MLSDNDIKQLLAKYDYPDFLIDSTTEEIKEMSHALAAALEQWAATGDEPDIEVAGYTYAALRVDYEQNPIAAFLTLDWLAKDPEEATAALAAGIK